MFATGTTSNLLSTNEIIATGGGIVSAEVQQVGIKRVKNGFIVTVGCGTFVAKTWKEAAEGLELYWKDPVAAEKKYCRGD